MTCCKRVLMQRRTGLLNSAHGSSINLDGKPTADILLDSLVELGCTTFTGTENKLALIEVQLGCTQAIQGILNQAQREVVVVHGVGDLHLLKQTGAGLDDTTAAANVGVLTVLVAVAAAKDEGVVLVLRELLLQLVVNIVHPGVDNRVGLAAIGLLNDGQAYGELLVEIIAGYLVLDTYRAPLIAHGDGSREADITNLAGQLTLNESGLD
jgi:hypothetical protein